MTSKEIVLEDKRVDPVLAEAWLDECVALSAALGRAAERAELSAAAARGRRRLAAPAGAVSGDAATVPLDGARAERAPAKG